MAGRPGALEPAASAHPNAIRCKAEAIVTASPLNPADRVEIPKQALASTFKGAGFLSEMRSLNIDVAPDSSQMLEQIIEGTISAPHGTTEQAKLAAAI